MQIAVMDYCLGQIRVYDVPKDFEDKDAEELVYIMDPDYKDSQCYYITSDNEIEIIVYE